MICVLPPDIAPVGNFPGLIQLFGFFKYSHQTELYGQIMAHTTPVNRADYQQMSDARVRIQSFVSARIPIFESISTEHNISRPDQFLNDSLINTDVGLLSSDQLDELRVLYEEFCDRKTKTISAQSLGKMFTAMGMYIFDEQATLAANYFRYYYTI